MPSITGLSTMSSYFIETTRAEPKIPDWMLPPMIMQNLESDLQTSFQRSRSRRIGLVILIFLLVGNRRYQWELKPAEKYQLGSTLMNNADVFNQESLM
ncbi:hypothetical protein KQX54_001920 [Cotesia glomerata]|uniref:Uncharacterized protein n=1 Tax=Cotesia glomerata TaxID=32391 RepID=A0AAV7IEE0_COTGL|nr:hypothetical protein KQX54_001920 [Cotesia glomerata]